MKKTRILIIFLTICLGTFGLYKSSWAANWYVDRDATGTPDGRSWATAWKSPHDIVWGGSGVQAGDTVYMSGGTTSKTYVSPSVSWVPDMDAMLHITISGTGNNRITVATGAKAPGNPPEHSGRVIFDCNQQYMCANAINQSYITLDGEKNGTINWELKNNETALSQDFIMLSNGGAQVGNRIRYLEIHDGANALYVRSGCDLEIEHCRIYDIYEDHLIRAIDGCGDLGSIRIHDNDLTARAGENNSWYGPDVIQGTYGIDVYNNIFRIDYRDTIGYQHQDMIQTDEHKTRIWNNLFLGSGYAIWSNNWPGNGPSTIEDFWFINNVVINPNTIATLEPVTGNGTTVYNRIYILNNTFVDCDGSQVFRMSIGSGVEAVNVRIENNIIYNSGKQNDVAAWVADYRATPCNSDIVFDYNTLYAGTRSNMVTCNGIEFPNIHGSKGQPSFANYVQGSLSSNLHLVSNDQYAKDKGADLSFLGIRDFNFRADRDGVLRPQGSAWDTGAYEFLPGGDTTAPASPNGLAVY